MPCRQGEGGGNTHHGLVLLLDDPSAGGRVMEGVSSVVDSLDPQGGPPTPGRGLGLAVQGGSTCSRSVTLAREECLLALVGGEVVSHMGGLPRSNGRPWSLLRRGSNNCKGCEGWRGSTVLFDGTGMKLIRSSLDDVYSTLVV